MNKPVSQQLATATKALEAVSDTPRLDAELLMAHALGLSRNDLLLRARDLQAPPDFEALLLRRLAHEPVAYIRGYQEFWDQTLTVTPATLIPRGDSETLIEAARTHFEAARRLRESLISARDRARCCWLRCRSFPMLPVWPSTRATPRWRLHRAMPTGWASARGRPFCTAAGGTRAGAMTWGNMISSSAIRLMSKPTLIWRRRCVPSNRPARCSQAQTDLRTTSG